MIRFKILFAGALAFSAVLSARGQTAVTTPAEPQAAESTVKEVPADQDPGDLSKVRGLFDVDLPKTVEKTTIKIIVHPHFGDLTHRDYLRIPVGVRFGINSHTEINAELEGYVTHGLKKGNAGNGLDNFRLGAKYQWQKWLKGEYEASTGVNFSFPLSRPPIDLVDGHNHVAPYVVFSKILPNHPKLTPFITFGGDFLWHSSVPGSFAKNQPASNAIGISPGFLLDRGTIKYTLVAAFSTTALVGKGSKNYASLNPSVLWQLPPSLTFHSKSQWIFGFGARVSTGPDGTNVGTSAKLRGEFKLARIFGPAPAK